MEENKRSRAVADEAQRGANIRAELQRLGVTKVDLAYKAVQDGIVRAEDGRLVARGESGEQPVGEFSPDSCARILNFCRPGLPEAPG